MNGKKFVSENRKAILVTGVSSGIGNHIAKYLAQNGCKVYGTVRKDDDLVALENIDNLTPIKLDVRNQELINQAYDRILADGSTLYGLVNNAGIGGIGILSTWTVQELMDIFDVNVFGPHRMTNTFMEMLVESKGRIVNIGSQGGMITSKYYGPYTMTKHALEAYTDALHQELEPYGVWVSVVQPGGVLSNASENAMPGSIARFERARGSFKAEAEMILESFYTPPSFREVEAESETNRKPSSPEIVSKAVYHALFAEQPKLRYLVGTKWEGDRVINGLISKLLDENNNDQHNYSREELVTLLDHHIELRKKQPS